MNEHSHSKSLLAAPFSFDEAWQSLPFNIKLMLLHIQRAEQEPWPHVED